MFTFRTESVNIFIYLFYKNLYYIYSFYTIKTAIIQNVNLPLFAQEQPVKSDNMLNLMQYAELTFQIEVIYKILTLKTEPLLGPAR